MQYPLQLTFKWSWTLSSRLAIADANGNLQFFVKPKRFKLKEAITVFADEQRQQPLYQIKADRVIDFSARYDFTDMNGVKIGAVKRHGLKSLWKARYDVYDDRDNVTFTIQEKNPWVKIADSVFQDIPIVGMLSGFVFNPSYLVLRADGAVVMRLGKIPAFFSRLFTVKMLDKVSDREEKQILLGLAMMLLLEKDRG